MTPPAGAQDDKKAPPSALDVLRGGAFGSRDAQGGVPSQGPSGGRSAAKASALLTANPDRARAKSEVPPPAAGASAAENTLLGVDKKVAAGLAAGAGIVLIALSGGAAIPLAAGAVLLVGGGAYLGSRLFQAAKDIKSSLDAAPKR